MESNIKEYSNKILARSARGIVIAIDENQVAKLSYLNSYEQLEKESKKMSFANKINDLVVKFHELKKDENENNLLIMERVYPLQYRALDVETRLKYCNEFESKLRELHNSGFVYRDLAATLVNYYSNFILTNEGIRLIDTGISLLKSDIGSYKFEKFVNKEITEINFVKRQILSNEIQLSTLT